MYRYTFNMHYESLISKDPIIYFIEDKSPSKNLMVFLDFAEEMICIFTFKKMFH